MAVLPRVTAACLAGFVAASLQTVPAAAQEDHSHDCVVDVHMKRGTDRIVLHGVLTHQRSWCAYHFKAHAGQTLYWTVNGPATRQTITYPDGTADGPGIPSPLPLPQDGEYVFGVGANLMADGAFGPYTLTMKIR
jgi:hypothetical protein